MITILNLSSNQIMLVSLTINTFLDHFLGTLFPQTSPFGWLHDLTLSPIISFTYWVKHKLNTYTSIWQIQITFSIIIEFKLPYHINFHPRDACFPILLRNLFLTYTFLDCLLPLHKSILLNILQGILKNSKSIKKVYLKLHFAYNK